MSYLGEHEIFSYASVDELMFLDHNTPPGLYRTESDWTYLVVAATDGVRAIALNVPGTPTFAVQKLDARPVAYGWWKGPFVVRLKGSSVESYYPPAPLGMITTSDFDLELTCCLPDATVQHVPLCYVKGGVPEDHVIEFFDHWELVEKNTGIVFFERALGHEYPCTWFGGYKDPRPVGLMTVEFPG